MVSYLNVGIPTHFWLSVPLLGLTMSALTLLSGLPLTNAALIKAIDSLPFSNIIWKLFKVLSYDIPLLLRFIHPSEATDDFREDDPNRISSEGWINLKSRGISYESPLNNFHIIFEKGKESIALM